MSTKKIFLTGGNGFIGKNFIERLGDKYEIVAPTRSELNLLDADAVMNFIQKIKPDIVLHAANIGGLRTRPDAPDVFENNLKMFFNIVRARPYFGRLINLGSGAEYDKRNPLVKVGENDFDRSVPSDHYGLSKYVCAQFAMQSDFITHVRLFGVYGKYEDYLVRFISNSICKTILDLPITINQNVNFDYLYVNDLVGILDNLIAVQPKQKVYNIGRGESADLLSLAQMIIKISGKNLPATVAKPGLNNEYSCDVSRYNAEFGQYRYTDYEQSITELFDYYRSGAVALDKAKFVN